MLLIETWAFPSQLILVVQANQTSEIYQRDLIHQIGVWLSLELVFWQSEVTIAEYLHCNCTTSKLQNHFKMCRFSSKNPGSGIYPRYTNLYQAEF